MDAKQDFLRALTALPVEDVIKLVPRYVRDRVIAGAISISPDYAMSTSLPLLADAAEVPRPTAAKKQLKALNAFIAFRSYYGKVFPSVAQKDISTLIKVLWKNDPFRAQWQIIAQVWSFIRDSKVDGLNATLANYLVISAPAMGVVPNSHYFQMLGYELRQENKTFSLIRARKFEKKMLQASYPASADSQFGLVQYLSNTGFLGHYGQYLLGLLHERPNIFVPGSRKLPSTQVQKFIPDIRVDPVGAAATMLGIPREHSSVNMGITITRSSDFNSVDLSNGFVNTPIGNHMIGTDPFIDPAASGNSSPDSAGPCNFTTGYEAHDGGSFDLDTANATGVDIGSPS